HRRDALWQVEKTMYEGDLFDVAAGVPPAVEPGLQPGGPGAKPESADESRKAVPGGTTTPATPGPTPDASSPLKPMNYAERIQADFAGMNLTTGKHPMALVRSKLPGITRAADLAKAKHGLTIRIAGNVICRQRPGTAKGFVFISLEDETGISNAIVTPPMFEANRLLITEEPFLVIEGRLQHVDNVIHVKAEKISRLEHDSLVGAGSYDFH
ncbi:MAG TPA: OB-fold nucleic acid binding domain-containing protein, partial [Verrucomicrobiae bacterium]|nr:OB-fold nucleic acid binding domain-containing protein [Verrucomicrobiae bacterium]